VRSAVADGGADGGKETDAAGVAAGDADAYGAGDVSAGDPHPPIAMANTTRRTGRVM